MIRLATYVKGLGFQDVSPNCFTKLSQAGFAFCNVSGKIKCEGCGANHNMMNIRNHPSDAEYHHRKCRFISPIPTNSREVPDYSTFEARLKSFELPSFFPLDPYDLALISYYYDGRYFFVRCYKCNNSFCMHRNVDRLACELREGRPIICECSRNLQRLSETPLIDQDTYSDENIAPHVQATNDTFTSTFCTNASRESHKIIETGLTQPEMASEFQPKFPQYSQQERLDSFSAISKNATNVPVMDYALFGAFYVDVDQECCCFYCGLRFVIDEHPSQAHQKMNPDCAFIVAVKQNV